MLLLVIVATAELSTRLLATVALTANTVDSANSLPPAAVTVLSMAACRSAFSMAFTAMSPLTVKLTLLMFATTLLTTSLRTTCTPTPVASEAVMFPNEGIKSASVES